MKILVDEMPKVCYGCLFLGSVVKDVYGKVECYSGCTLLNNRLTMDTVFTTRLGNCPLLEVQNDNS